MSHHRRSPSNTGDIRTSWTPPSCLSNKYFGLPAHNWEQGRFKGWKLCFETLFDDTNVCKCECKCRGYYLLAEPFDRVMKLNWVHFFGIFQLIPCAETRAKHSARLQPSINLKISILIICFTDHDMTSLVFVRISAVDDRTAIDDVIVVAVQDTDKLQQANEQYICWQRIRLKERYNAYIQHS